MTIPLTNSDKLLHVSKSWMDFLKKDPLPNEYKEETIFGGIKIIAHPMFPFEMSYPACDIETKEEVKISSGEFIHAAMVSQNLEDCISPSPILFHFDADKMITHSNRQIVFLKSSAPNF